MNSPHGAGTTGVESAGVALSPLVSTGRCGLAVDFDGTLSPIVSDPAAASLEPAAGRALNALASRLPAVAVVSGRTVDDLRQRVCLDRVTYIGSHGSVWLPQPQQPLPPWDAPDLQALEDMVETLSTYLAAQLEEGVQFESKPTGLAIHFRNAHEPVRAARAIARAVKRIEYQKLGLEPLWGKCVLELRPTGAPTKGSALIHFVREHDLRAVIYIGDDRTDVDAFRAIRTLRQEEWIPGLAVGVISDETPPIVHRWIDLALNGVTTVATFLDTLLDLTADARQ